MLTVNNFGFQHTAYYTQNTNTTFIVHAVVVTRYPVLWQFRIYFFVFLFFAPHNPQPINPQARTRNNHVFSFINLFFQIFHVSCGQKAVFQVIPEKANQVFPDATIRQ